MKPESILKLEKELGIKLRLLKERDILDYSNRNRYLLNQSGEVVGLNIRRNEIVDISILKELNQLSSLGLSENQIADISPLKELNQLTSLGLSENQIPDASPLKELNLLRVLDLSVNQIDDTSPLKGLNQLMFLNLSENQITDVSPLKDLNQLTVLKLSRNKIEDITALESIKGLSVLSLSDNKIKNIFSLGQLKKIKYLNLNGNFIQNTIIFKNLKNIEELYLSRTKITNFLFLKEFKKIIKIGLADNKIDDIAFLGQLKYLKSLNLKGNKITDISCLKELNQLKDLFLTSNRIANVSSLRELDQLTTLYLNDNKITDVSALKEIKHLQNLDLSFNEIADISPLKELPHLQYLDLSFNKIVDVSPFLNKIKFGIQINLDDHFFYKGISLKANPIEYPPIDVLNKGNDEIIKWFEETDKYGEEPLYESKLLIVGEPNAGKTSLRKKLIDPTFEIKDGTIEETIGVYVHDGYNFPYYKNQSIAITSHIWDFGGQEKQYPLHQYFLKDKSVYALLSLDRGDNQYLDKWFSIIRLLSGNENEIILVLNQKNRTSQSSNFNKTKYENQGFKFKEYILDLSNDSERFNLLQSDIQKALASLPHIGNMFPKYCKKIADAIDKKRFNDHKDYLTYEEYENLCLDLDLKEDDVPKKALNYLSIIGKIIHYDDDCNLERIIIINPHWLIDAIYGVLTCVELDEFHQKGKFTKQWLIDYLKKPTELRPNGYKESESLHILNLMLKNHFDICYQVEDVFLIPLCMPEILPENDFDAKDSIQVLFKYEVMPSGMVARVLVRLNEYIKENYISKTSGILINENNSAKIEEYYLPNDANRYIRIIVNGNLNSRKEFLNLIKNELIKVQKDWFDKLEVNELIPCICEECKSSGNKYYFEMKELQKSLNKEKFFKECRLSTDEVNIFELLGEVYEFGIEKKINSMNDLAKTISEKNKAISIEKIFDFFGEENSLKAPLNIFQIIQNLNVDEFTKIGEQFNISSSNPNSQFGGKNNKQQNYHNIYYGNDVVSEIKDLLSDLKSSEQINEEWRKNFTDAYVEMSKLEEAEEKEVETKSISYLQKFFTKAKEIKDWVAIGVLPAEIATKGGKMIELGQELLKLFVK